MFIIILITRLGLSIFADMYEEEINSFFNNNNDNDYNYNYNNQLELR